MKDFENWHKLKQELHKKTRLPTFNERDIWWCNLGVNLGHEEDGKNTVFSRPVLIIKKFNNRLFWGVPLTTQVKKTKHYHQFDFKNRKQCAMLTQLRLWDATRLIDRMGRTGVKEFNQIKIDLMTYLK